MNQTTTPPPPVVTPAKRTRRVYDAAFKQSAVAHCLRHGGDVTRSARDLGVNAWTLRDWVAAARRPAAPATPPTVAELQSELGRLRADMARLTEQRDILKKSLGILSLP
jgi:transposase